MAEALPSDYLEAELKAATEWSEKDEQKVASILEKPFSEVSPGSTYVPGPYVLPPEILEMDAEDLACKYCGVSYLIYNRFKTLREIVSEKEKELAELRHIGFQARQNDKDMLVLRRALENRNRRLDEDKEKFGDVMDKLIKLRAEHRNVQNELSRTKQRAERIGWEMKAVYSKLSILKSTLSITRNEFSMQLRETKEWMTEAGDAQDIISSQVVQALSLQLEQGKQAKIAEAEAARARTHQLTDDLEAARNEASRLRAEYENFKRESEELTSDLQTRNAANSCSVGKQSKEIDGLNVVLRSKDEELASLNARLAVLQEDTQTEVQKLQVEVRGLSTEKQQLSTQVATVSDDLARLTQSTAENERLHKKLHSQAEKKQMRCDAETLELRREGKLLAKTCDEAKKQHKQEVRAQEATWTAKLAELKNEHTLALQQQAGKLTRDHALEVEEATVNLKMSHESKIANLKDTLGNEIRKLKEDLSAEKANRRSDVDKLTEKMGYEAACGGAAASQHVKEIVDLQKAKQEAERMCTELTARMPDRELEFSAKLMTLEQQRVMERKNLEEQCADIRLQLAALAEIAEAKEKQAAFTIEKLENTVQAECEERRRLSEALRSARESGSRGRAPVEQQRARATDAWQHAPTTAGVGRSQERRAPSDADIQQQLNNRAPSDADTQQQLNNRGSLPPLASRQLSLEARNPPPSSLTGRMTRSWSVVEDTPLLHGQASVMDDGISRSSSFSNLPTPAAPRGSVLRQPLTRQHSSPLRALVRASPLETVRRVPGGDSAPGGDGRISRQRSRDSFRWRDGGRG